MRCRVHPAQLLKPLPCAVNGVCAASHAVCNQHRVAVACNSMRTDVVTNMEPT